MNGCCVDKKAGTGTPCTSETCMALPAGKTCGDCVHVKRCVAIFGVKPHYTHCDFFPRRFRLPVVDATETP